MKNQEEQNLKEKVSQLRKDIWELAKSNYGVVNREIIIETLDADAELVEASLKKMRAKIRGNLVYFPKIEKAFRKRWTWRRIWPFKN
jgi:hypothetical protein